MAWFDPNRMNQSTVSPCIAGPHYRTGKEESLCDLMTLPHGEGGGGG